LRWKCHEACHSDARCVDHCHCRLLAAFAAGEKKEERFFLSSAVVPAHRTDNTLQSSSAGRDDRQKNTLFAIGLEALKWVGRPRGRSACPIRICGCADFVNFVLGARLPANQFAAAKIVSRLRRRIDSPRAAHRGV